MSTGYTPTEMPNRFMLALPSAPASTARESAPKTSTMPLRSSTERPKVSTSGVSTLPERTARLSSVACSSQPKP